MSDGAAIPTYTPHIFGHARLGYGTIDTVRRRRLPKFKMVATETGTGNDY